MAHILFLTDNFPPEINAPASRTFEHCREWVKLGHEVTVITGVPNFPKGIVYEGYKNRLYQSQRVDGINVIRVWTYITANEGFAPRILDYTSYMVAAILAAPLVRNVDVVIGTSPHLLTACAGYAVSRMKKIPFVFELRDLWPASIRAVGAISEGPLLRALERTEMFLYRKASSIVALTDAFKEDLTQRGIAEHKISVITNGVDLERFRPKNKNKKLVARYGLAEKFVVGYIGTHGLAHGLSTLIYAADHVRRYRDGHRYRFLFLGDGAMKSSLIAEAAQRELGNVVFIDTVPKSEVTDHWALLDASIIHLRRDSVFDTVIPSKLFESMAMGIPVLLGVRGESARIVEKEDVGLIFEPENWEDLCRALVFLGHSNDRREAFRENCLKAAGRYDRRTLARRMLEILHATVSATTGRTSKAE